MDYFDRSILYGSLLLACSVACMPACKHTSEGGATGYEQLYLAVTAALEESWSAGDPALTQTYYRDKTDSWQMIDLNDDGVDEAVCQASMAVFEPGKPQYIGGATGNAPLFVFQEINGRWRLIASMSGVDHEFLDKRVNGWPVLLNTWHLGGPETGTAVMIYDQDRYKTVHTYEQRD